MCLSCGGGACQSTGPIRPMTEGGQVRLPGRPGGANPGVAANPGVDANPGVAAIWGLGRIGGRSLTDPPGGGTGPGLRLGTRPRNDNGTSPRPRCDHPIVPPARAAQRSDHGLGVSWLVFLACFSVPGMSVQGFNCIRRR